MASIGKVTLDGLPLNDFHNTFFTEDSIVQADASRKAAVTYSATDANTVKLAVDGEKINGRLEIFEDRILEQIKVGTVARKGGVRFEVSPVAASASPAVLPALSSYLVGAVDANGKGGYVRAATANEVQAGKDNWQVVEVYVSADGTKTYAVAVDQ